TLLWHHRLGHPSLPRLQGMASRTLVSSLPRSLPPLPLGPAPTCVPCVEGRQRAAPHSSEFPPTEAPLQTLHMDVVSARNFKLPASPQQNGIAEHRIGMVMDVARTSMIHAAALHFLWPFAVQYAGHQINLTPRISLPETTPTLRWTGKVGDASVFRVWGSRAFFRDASADKLSSRTVPCVFLGFPPDAPGWQFYHPTSRRVLSSQDVTFDESVSYYRLFPYRSSPLPSPPLFLAPGAPPVDPLPPQGPAPSGVSHVDPVEPVEVAVDSGAPRGVETAGAGPGGAEPGVAESGGAVPERVEPGGAESGGAESGGSEPGGAEPERAESGGPPGVPLQREPLSLQQLPAGGASGAAGGAAGVGGIGTVRGRAGVGGAGGAGAAGPGGARTGGTGAAGAGGAVRVGAVGAGTVPSGGAAGAGAVGGHGACGAMEVSAGDPGAEGTSAISALQPASPPPSPSPYLGPTRGLTERREPETRHASPESRPESPVRTVSTGRHVPRQRPPPVPGTHSMILRPSTAPKRVPLPSPPASSLPALACWCNPTSPLEQFRQWLDLRKGVAEVLVAVEKPKLKANPVIQPWRLYNQVLDHLGMSLGCDGRNGEAPKDNPEKSPWVRKSAQGYLLLGQALGSSQIRHIKPFQREPEKGPKAWAALKGVHAPATAAVAVMLEWQMAALRIEEDEAVEEGVQKFFDMLTRLEGADLNYSELQKKTKLLALLPESWFSLIINLNRDLPRLSLEDVKRAILQEDFRRHELASADGAGAASISQGYGRGRGRGQGGGRFGSNSFNEGRGSGGYGSDNKSYRRGRGRFNGECHYCHKSRHMWRDCYKLLDGWTPAQGQEGRGAGGGRGRSRGGRGGRGGGAASMKSASNESESRDDHFPGKFFFVSMQAQAGPEKDEGFEEPAAVGKVTLHSLDYWTMGEAVGSSDGANGRAKEIKSKKCNLGGTSKLGEHEESGAVAKKQLKDEENPKVAAEEEYGENMWGTIAMKNEMVAGIRVKGEPDEVLGCPTCMQGKFTRYLFSSSEAMAKAPLDEVVMDVVAPLKLGAAGAEYFLTIVDVYTRITWVYVLSKKSDVAETVKTDWLPMVERQQDRLVKAIRIDRGGEFQSKDFSLWLKKNCIRHSLTMPYSPAMNSIAERANRTNMETARGLLIEARLPDYFWPDAVRSACAAKNRALTHVGADKWVPYVEWIGRKPKVDMLRVFGCMWMALVPKHLRHNKLGAKEIWAVHLGMAQNSKGWLLWDPFTKKFLVSRDCKFMENMMYKDWKAENEAKIGMRFGEVKSSGLEHVELPLEPSSSSTTTRQSSLVNGGEEAKDAEEEEEEVQQVSERALTLPSRTTSAPRIRVNPQQRHESLHVPAAKEEGRGKRRIQAPNRLTYDALGKPAKSALAGAALI
ncbi:unnamed protein product, partial [Closterium sp. NIES-53]